MESLHHRGRSNRFLLCFRPLPMAGSLKPDQSQHHSTDQVLAYIAVSDKDHRGVVVPAIISTLPDDNYKASGREFNTTRRKKRGFTRHFSRVLKAVLFDTSLVKRIRSRKSRKCSFRSVNSAKNENFSNLVRDNLSEREPLEFQYGTDDRRTKSTSHTPRRSASADHLSSASMHPNCSLSLTSKPSALPRKSAPSLKSASVRHNTAELNQKRASYTCLCLILVSLFALVFWGKICAIFCASTWLFLVPHYNHGIWSPDHCEASDHCEAPDHCESPDLRVAGALRVAGC
ncbi:uncharacterized protein At5g23160 [Vitis riparia]|uniref:uncharacterized protein At5g23160 n=1 Tax=Vitis riparia TaxID=96939 RepID=UPI00155B29D6|nr:uncharacterized protein At5g23160 [Vitis riparia]